MAGTSPDRPSSSFEIAEPSAYRWMRFGLPSGLAFFLLIAAYLGTGFHPLFVAFVAAFVLLLSQAVAINLLTAHHIRVDESGVQVRTLMRHVSIPWNDISRVELVDRRDQAHPRRLARVIASRGRQFFVLDSIRSFDAFLDEVRRRDRAIIGTSLPLWKRFLLLQWGV